MPKVYVTQLPMKRDKGSGLLQPVFNINTAQEHGELVVMMSPQAGFRPTADLTQELSFTLADYDYEGGDAVLLLGDTTLITITCVLLARRNKRIAVLRWDRTLARYTRVVVTV